MRQLRPTRLDAGIFLLSLAVLLIELLLTRIFSVTLFYHLSFMVVSIAMLGLGVGGLVVNLWPGWFARGLLERQLAAGSLLFATTAVVAVSVAFNLSVSLEVTSKELPKLALIYLACVVPFLMGGLVIALILTSRADRANRLYFFDLMGAALACVVFIPLTNLLGAPSAVLVGAAVAAAAAVVFAGAEAPDARRLAGVSCALLLIGAAANLRWNFYDVRSVKGARQTDMLALKWNSFSRVEVAGRPSDVGRHAPVSGGNYSTRLDPSTLVVELPLRYDGSAQTQILKFDGNLETVSRLGYDVSAAPYHVRPCPSVLVIGPGGGRDVLKALYHGSTNVTGVEVNPLTVELMRGKFRDFTGRLYDGYPGVNVVVDEGRSFLRDQKRGPYDLIEASLVDSWAATAAGAYALTENNLYTVEAFESYLSHLTPHGMISFTRWAFNPPVEPLRVVSLATEALHRHGAADPPRHICVVRSETICTILVKRSPFTPEEMQSLRGFVERMAFRLPYAPDESITAPGNNFQKLLGPDAKQFRASYAYDVSPVYDDRPFFFDRIPLLNWVAHRLHIASSPIGSGDLTLGGRSLLACLIVSAACTLILMVLPLLAMRTRRGETEPDGSARVTRARGAAYALYFAGLGLGFIMVEIVLLQRFNLFFGYPVYSLAVVLFTILLASAAGSYLSGRWDGPRVLPRILAALCAALLVYAIALPRALDALLAAPLTVRIVATVIILAPLGLLMGMPFPSGLRRAGRESTRLVSWAWAVNGVSSVFGSTLTMLISMTYGFTVSFLAGAAAYATSLVLISSLSRATEPQPAPAAPAPLAEAVA